MNRTPTTEDFRRELDAQFKCAKEQGKSQVNIKSENLHRDIGGYPGDNHRMPTCCEVMYGEMRAGDKVIVSPPKDKGASLTIEYQLPR